MEVKTYESDATPSRMSAQRSIQNEVELVGLEDDFESIIQLLTRGAKEFDIISIVGMGGLGKTTLARKVFKDYSVTAHFDVLAWCSISQTYSVRELLLNILKQVQALRSDVDAERDVVADMLRKCLIGKRYLIVLDDIWDVEAWEELKLSFPNGENGNRIILTTRLKQLAMQVKCSTDPYCLRFLTTEESWKLLQKKAFQDETCPPELWDVGLQVTEACKGLPLVIVLIGGILLTKARNVTLWEEVAWNLKAHLSSVETNSSKVIQLSYSNLPDHLKPCLLYMGVFPEDAEIRVSKLLLMWMAEGFVQCSDNAINRPEEAGVRYLIDLISCSLVMVSKVTFNGKVKCCRMHDLVRDFCLNRAKEDKFMHVVGQHNLYPPLYNSENRLCLHIDSGLRRDLETINYSLDTYLTSYSKKENILGSLFITDDDEAASYSPKPYIFGSLGELKLLRVLDLMNFFIEDCGQPLQSLVHLRYLGLRSKRFKFDWVLHLSHLETLLVHHSAYLMEPPAIWKMIKLRHVYMNVPAFLKKTSANEPSKLENLRSFHKLRFYDSDNTEKLMESFPNLEELAVEPACCSEFVDYLSLKFHFLKKLQSLTIDFCRVILVPQTPYFFLNVSFPSSLKELILKYGTIPSSAISTIAELPNLERLKFSSIHFNRFCWCWDVREVTFPALKFLKFSNMDFDQWLVSESSFPVLESLILRACLKLKEIPNSFVDVETLKCIKVVHCNESLKASALKIMEEVVENTGCDGLNVDVSSPKYRRHKREFKFSILE